MEHETIGKRESQKIIDKYGVEKAIKILRIALKAAEEEVKKIKPGIKYGPNPAHIKTAVLAMVRGKIFTLDDLWKILNIGFGIKDAKRNYALAILDWNPSIFQRVTKERGDRRWKLTKYGQELAKHLTSGKTLTFMDKTILSALYLNEPITLEIYKIFKNQNRRRKEGIQLLAKQSSTLEITPEQADYYVGEKTGALVALGLLERIRGRETTYT